MSLDVYLEMPVGRTESGSGIFIRENGATREITREEWDRRFPGTEPVVANVHSENTVYERNITHNLNKMADAAGIYEHLWRPDEIGITTARELIAPLRTGLELLRSDPERFKAFNPSNGWGDYEGLVDFVQSYVSACEKYPLATVRVSR